MDANHLQVGECLKELRTARKLTLDETANLTGVSKPMLGQIERGQSSPTINTLWKIATGLKVPLSYFCRHREAEYLTAGPSTENRMTEEDGRMRAYTLFPFDPVRNVEVFFIEFDAGVRHSSPAHAKGVEEYLFVVQGSFLLQIADQPVDLPQGQAIRFQADVPHTYTVTSEIPGLVYNIIFYPADQHS